MYNNNSEKDLVGAALISALGAGIVTSFAVGQGQHPMIALGITAFAAVCGVIFRQFDIV